MFPTLIESDRKTNKPKLFSIASASLAVHAAVITGAVYGTLHAAARHDGVVVDTTVVMLAPERQAKPPEQQPVQLDVPLKGFQTVVALPEMPTTLPALDLHEHFDPKDYSGSGVEGGRAQGMAPGDNLVYLEAAVEQRPVLLSGPPPYPELLREARIQGRVVVQGIVDTTGRLEPRSVKIVQTPSPAFQRPIMQWAGSALFRPARLQGRAVRVWVRLPLDYAVTSN